MRKTTVYLPDDLKASLARMAHDVGKSEAEVIRDAIAAATRAHVTPRPRFPLGRSGRKPIAHDIDSALASAFGRR